MDIKSIIGNYESFLDKIFDNLKVAGVSLDDLVKILPIRSFADLP